MHFLPWVSLFLFRLLPNVKLRKRLRHLNLKSQILGCLILPVLYFASWTDSTPHICLWEGIFTIGVFRYVRYVRTGSLWEWRDGLLTFFSRDRVGDRISLLPFNWDSYMPMFDLKPIPIPVLGVIERRTFIEIRPLNEILPRVGDHGGTPGLSSFTFKRNLSGW